MAASVSSMDTKAPTVTIDSRSLVCADTQYIAHQCNVDTSTSNSGQTIFRSFPFADIYGGHQKGKKVYPSDAKSELTAGSIDVRMNPKEGPHVIAMLAQLDTGMPKEPLDTAENRVKWFQQCLQHMKALDMHSVAFPESVGCDTAGGSWPAYKKMIEVFATENPQIRVVICTATMPAPRKLSFSDC
jgi:hypothetical protein